MSDKPLDRRDMTLRQKLSIPEDADPPWSVLTATLSVLVLLINIILVGPSVATLQTDDPTQVTPFMLMLGWTIGLALTIVFVVIQRRSSAESWSALKLVNGLVPIPIVLLIGVAIALLIDVIMGLASGAFLPIPEIFGLQAEGIAGVVVAALLLVIIQPVAETLVFQGVLLPKLRVVMGPWGGVVMTTVVFTLVHYGIYFSAYETAYPDSAMLWYGVAYPLIAGLAFSLLKVYTQSTRAVGLARASAGLMFLLTALVVVT